ncbi:MAG: glycosyltransferase family 4 protein [Candidatus Buchananbacteria bacterium]
MKLAIYQPRASYFVGGGEVVPLQEARFLALAGHQITLVTTRASFIKPSEYFLRFVKNNPKVKVEYIVLPAELQWIYREVPGQRWIRWDYESIHVGRLAFAYFLKNKFDLLLVHNYLDSIAIPPDQKSISYLHGYPPAANYLHELFAVVPSAFIADSLLIKEKWQALAGLTGIQVATNGVDASFFKPQYKKTKYDVLYLGRLIKTKGVAYLIEAMAELRTLPDLRLAIAGSGPELSNLKSLANKLGIKKRISFLGYIKDEDLPELYNSSAICVFPSYDREGILTVMLEAAACGRPIITTSACSMSEFLRNGYNGLLVKPQSVSAIAQAIKKLYCQPVVAEKLGRQARKSIKQQWSWEKKIKKMEKIYAQVVSRH